MAIGALREAAPLSAVCGCVKCKTLENATREALVELGMDTTIDHVTDFSQIAAYGAVSYTHLDVYKRQLNASVQENVSAIRVVKAYVREDHETQKFHTANDNVYTLFKIVVVFILRRGPHLLKFLYQTCHCLLYTSICV